jgi:SOS-response transcriptional repressor LexA
MFSMQKSADRLYQAAKLMRKIEGQSNLAKLLGQSPQVIKNWESRGVSKAGAIIAQKLIGCDSNWLLSGTGEMMSSKEVSNVEDGPDYKTLRLYPVISDVQAGTWTETCESFNHQDAEQWRPSEHDLGHCGFMLRVKGISMMDPSGRYTFPPGLILHVRPERDPMPGQFVVVRRAGENGATFKKLVNLDGTHYLEAINPEWPERYMKLQDGDVICGVVKHAGFDTP